MANPNQCYEQKVQAGQIRLILLHPSPDFDDPITLSFKYDDFDNIRSRSFKYDALSYCWGDDTTVAPIAVQSNHPHGQVSQLPIRTNLHKALQYLRFDKDGRWLWIDALSIRQDDEAEVAVQIAQMDRIYRNAFRVCVWLGEDYHFSHLAMDLIPRVIDLKNFESITNSAAEIPNMQAFAHLLYRPWFSRRWVVQEILLSHNARVYCGQKSVTWDQFSMAVELFESKANDIRAWDFMLKKPEVSKAVKLPDFRGSGAGVLVALKNGALRTRNTRQLTLDYLVATLAPFEASKPHDKIFSLLALVQEADRLEIDYAKPLVELCLQVVERSIDVTGSLDIICRPWAPSYEELYRERTALQKQGRAARTWHMPTWVCQQERSGFSDRSARAIERYVGRSTTHLFIGKPGKPVYNACGKEQLARRTYKSKFNIPQLAVYGVTIGVIDAVGKRAEVQSVPGDWAALAGWHSVANPKGSATDVPERYWRTLIGDRTSDGRLPPLWYRQACFNIFTLGCKPSDPTEPPQTLEYLTRMQTVVRHRRMFTTKPARIGLGPNEHDRKGDVALELIKPGDLVCILSGCSVPVILRAVPDAATKRFMLIGECYVHGIMDGDKMEDLDPEVKFREYSIC